MVQLKLLAISMIWCWSLWTTDHQGAVADPQTLLPDTCCSANNVNATNLPIFLANLNAMFCDLRSQVSDQCKHFATAQQGTGDSVAYAMFQCRNDLSQADCLACFDTASAQIRNVCSTANGARVIYDGCFLRYESQGFSDQTTAQGNGVLCGSQNTSNLKNRKREGLSSNKWIAIGVAIAVLVGIPLGIYVYALCKKRPPPKIVVELSAKHAISGELSAKHAIKGELSAKHEVSGGLCNVTTCKCKCKPPQCGGCKPPQCPGGGCADECGGHCEVGGNRCPIL